MSVPLTEQEREALAWLPWHPPRKETWAAVEAIVTARERAAEVRALRAAADEIETDPGVRLGHNVSVVCSCLRCDVAHAAAGVARARAERIEATR